MSVAFHALPIDSMFRSVMELFGLVLDRALGQLVRLPADFTCQDCTLRLVRQANEWGKSYRFWSCADIDIVPSESFLRLWSLSLGTGGSPPKTTWQPRPCGANVDQWPAKIWGFRFRFS